MKTNNLISILRTGILALSCTAFLASCTPETVKEANEPLYTMGDPKNMSEQGSRCFELTEFTVAGENVTLNYEEIIWTFKNNGTVTASSPMQQWPGNWNIGQVDGVQSLFLAWDDSLPPQITALSGIWNVESLDLENPQFSNAEGDILQFASASCTTVSPELETLNAFLRDSLFTVSNFIYQDNDVTDAFNDITFDFNVNNAVIAERDGQQRTGQWMTSETPDGLMLAIQFNSPALLTGLNATWNVVNFNSNGIILEYSDGPPGTGSFYTIELVNAN